VTALSTSGQADGAPRNFAPGAVRLAGLLPRLFGWRPGDLWDTTPAELAAILAPEGAGPADAPLSRAELDTLLEHDRHG